MFSYTSVVMRGYISGTREVGIRIPHGGWFPSIYNHKDLKVYMCTTSVKNARKFSRFHHLLLCRRAL
jgi:hypothetical protein